MAKKPAVDLEADAVAPAPTDTQMKQVTAMVQTMLDLERDLLKAQEVCAAFAARIDRMSSTDIPEAMKAIGLTMFQLSDGKMVKLEEEDYGSYTKDNEPAVFKWLKAQGHGDMIKNALNVQIGKGKETLVEKLQKVLLQKAYAGCVVEVKESLHATTFKAFVREQLAEGKRLPKQISIFHKSTIDIKEPKNGSRKKGSTSSKDTDLF
jgi:hypothetical protein